ncbi:hypothetical protein AB0F07_14790 [Streptomyces fructofermentans]|uniref:hypothetical protein n=1 Tax=Streptomyces fructofermentans TaxID=152141 RepID=UPI0033F092BD
MSQRGRHRRRKKGRVLRATLSGAALALTAAATIISTSQAAGSDNPGPLTPVTSSAEIGRLQLRENLADGTALDRLTGAMGGPVGVDTVLDGADHPMRNRADCDAGESAALPVEPAATRAYCWDGGDATTQEWRPQSVTTSGDADRDGRWGDDRVILAGWTRAASAADASVGEEGLARVAFIDASDPDALRYRWVLLVAPTADGEDFAPVHSRLGGMVWYQDKLITTAGDGTGPDDALLVFDMNRILRADAGGAGVGRSGDHWSADGHRYVLPAVGSYDLPGGTCRARDNDARPCFASLSLDRTSTPDSLVANEWFSPGGGEHARIWRYDYSTAGGRTGLLAGTARGVVNADEAYETEAVGLQGVLSHRPDGADAADWYTGHTPGGSDRNGTLWRQNESTAKAARCGSDPTYACWGRHTESLSYWQETGELWTLSGRAARGDDTGRVLYAVPLADVDGSVE